MNISELKSWKGELVVRKWEWVKTVLAAAAAVALMLFLGNREAFYSWVEALIYVGILAGGFYGGFAGGLVTGSLAGLLRWYVIGGELLQVIALMAGGVCCALFRQLGKSASCLAFLSGTAILYLLMGISLPGELFEALLVALAVFLLVSPEKKRRRPGEKSAVRESAAAAAPERAGTVSRLTEKKPETETDFAAAWAGQCWRRLADSFMTLSNSFDDQGVLFAGESGKLSAAEWKQRFLESRQALRLQLAQAGEVIRRQQEQLAARQEVTGYYEEKIRNRLKHRGVSVSRLQVMENEEGRQEIFALLACRRGAHMSSQEAAALFHTESGKKFCPAYDCRSVISTRPGTVHFIEKQNFKVLYGLARRNREGENCSGDSFSARVLGEDRMLLCLSDGMGTGKQAGMESEMAVDLLEQLLENGFSVTAAISMINHVLLNCRSRQSPTTLDVCVLNLYSGVCCFAKMGAAAGYLKRGESVSAIRGQAVPLGMISWDDMDGNMAPAEQLQSGDMLIMMTDGVSEKAGLAADEILKELISGCTIRNAEEMAGWLMDQLLMLDDTVQDDMTILVAGVWRR
ncbi:MAG: SpoIIE family protein phosphatase [Lachnospiraceae bacterium]